MRNEQRLLMKNVVFWVVVICGSLENRMCHLRHHGGKNQRAMNNGTKAAVIIIGMVHNPKTTVL
jgi:hypothetical protein